MRVAKIAHASIVVSTGDLRCFMDPVFEPSYENGANVFDPPISVDIEELVSDGNLIVISHAHRDHFSPRSLNHFDRSIPVIYPAGEPLIERALDRLGFRETTAAVIGEEIDVGDAILIPTPSRVPFAEMGMVFKADDQVFWNIVDTKLDAAYVGAMRRIVGRPDLLFAAYQPLVEEALWTNSLGSEFPFKDYAGVLRAVWMIQPRCVVPTACGFRYRRAWMNDRGFPITERQFAKDLIKGPCELSVAHVPHGGEIDLSNNFEVDNDGLRGVSRIGLALFPNYDWRPERGVPPLVDSNPRGHSPAMLRDEVARFLDESVLPKLAACDPVWLERFARLEVVWRLEVVFPEGQPVTKLVDFSRSPPAWLPDDGAQFAKIHTSVTASGMVGILRGEHNEYSYWFNEFRTAHRLYEVYADGVVENGGQTDDPLRLIVADGADERNLDRELDAIERENAES